MVGDGGGEEMRAFWAKVVGRSGVGFWGGFDARDGKSEVVVEGCSWEKGLVSGERGAEDEKGF